MGLLTTIPFYALVRKLYGRRAALLAVTFFLTSPTFMMFAREARHFTFLMFLIVCTLYYLYTATERRDDGSRALWVVFLVATLLAQTLGYGILPIIGLYVVDNQQIKKGDKIYKIDPVPFQLEVNTRQAQIEEQSALVKVAQEELATAKAALESAKSAHTYATEQQARYAVLAASDNAPRAELDRADNELRRTAAEKTIAEIAIAKAQTSINVHKAALDVATAEKATAEWKLSKTDVNAPADGWINNLTVRIGDTGTVSIPNIGIVDAHAWRIIANYKEYYIRPFEIDGTAWVWLDSAPWKLHKARITGIARGFSRDPQAPMLLPYVAPTTDWIRLQRRIPVTIVLEDPPPGGRLYMGADARAVVFPR